MKKYSILFLSIFTFNLFSQNLILNGDFELNKKDSMFNLGKFNYQDTTNYTYDSFVHNWNLIFGQPNYINKKLPISKYYGFSPFYAYNNLKAFRNSSYSYIYDEFTLTDSVNSKLEFDTFSNNYIGSKYNNSQGIYQKLLNEIRKDSIYIISYRFQNGFNNSFAVYKNLISGFGFHFSTYNLKSNFQNPINNFNINFQDTILNNNYSWKYLKYEFTADSNYKYINFATFTNKVESKYKIFDSSITIIYINGNLHSIGTFFTKFIDDIRLLPKWQYLDVTPDVYACEGDSVELKVLSGAGGYKWVESNNTNVILSTTNILKIKLADTNIKYQVMSPFDTALIPIYVTKNSYNYDTTNYKTCQNQPIKISVPNIKIWYDSSKDTMKLLTKSGAFWYETKNQCTLKRTSIFLQIDMLKYDSLKETSCDSFKYKNINYKNSGVYTFKYISAFGCDSFQTLDLKINASSFNLAKQFSCKPYLWQDSLYKTSGIYTKRYKTNQLCDSSLVLDLTIGLNDKIKLENGINYTALADSVSYQWYRCNPWRKITNETKKTFTTSTKGSYAVVVSNGTCTDTSECLALYSSSLQSVITANAVIYPNPFNSYLTIDLNQIHKEINIKIYDMTGRQVLNTLFKNLSTCDLKLESLSKGSYYLQIETETKSQFLNIYKE